MTDRAGLTDAECDALIRADLDKYYPNRDRNLDPLIRLEYRGWVRAAYAAGQAAASAPRVPHEVTCPNCGLPHEVEP